LLFKERRNARKSQSCFGCTDRWPYNSQFPPTARKNEIELLLSSAAVETVEGNSNQGASHCSHELEKTPKNRQFPLIATKQILSKLSFPSRAWERNEKQFRFPDREWKPAGVFSQKCRKIPTLVAKKMSLNQRFILANFAPSNNERRGI
jgi:hypothetical protein